MDLGQDKSGDVTTTRIQSKPYVIHVSNMSTGKRSHFRAIAISQFSGKQAQKSR